MLKNELHEVTFAFLDTETTGISALGGSRVCELAILKVRGGKPLESFQSLINPQCPIDLGAQSIHGISDEMVAQSPTFADLAPRVLSLLEGSAMVCHNAPFDLAFMREELRRAGLALPEMPVVDTLPLARRHFKFARNSLGHIARTLGIEPDGWHRAGNDVHMLRLIFERFLVELASKGARTLEDLLKL